MEEKLKSKLAKEMHQEIQHLANILEKNDNLHKDADIEITLTLGHQVDHITDENIMTESRGTEEVGEIVLLILVIDQEIEVDKDLEIKVIRTIAASAVTQMIVIVIDNAEDRNNDSTLNNLKHPKSNSNFFRFHLFYYNPNPYLSTYP